MGAPPIRRRSISLSVKMTIYGYPPFSDRSESSRPANTGRCQRPVTVEHWQTGPGVRIGAVTQHQWIQMGGV